MSQEESADERPGRKPLSAAVQKRLQTCFQHASQNMVKEAYDYACELFKDCVLGDPGNVIFAQSFIGNLRKKYDNNKKGGRSLKKLSIAASVKKAMLQKNWDAVLRSGLEMLKINPWEVSTLKSMATACKEIGCPDTQLVYLRSALDFNPNAPDVNRLCAFALTERREYDQALACWTRVLIAKPDDEEARRQMAALTVEKTIEHGKYQDRESTKDMANPKSKVSDLEKEMTGVTPEMALQKKIQRRPKDVSNYMALVNLHIEAEQFRKAEDLLAAAYEETKDDDVLQNLEDMKLRRLRQELNKARKQAEQSGNDDDKRRANELLKEFRAADLEFHESSCQRYPTNLALKYELGARYHQAGRFKEAIEQYQKGKGDPSKEGVCMLRLGECFEKIKQYGLAMDHYEKAIQTIAESDADNRKGALYRAAKLAFGLKTFDVAEKHATTLAGIDFGYKEVAALLDKITKMREDG